MNVLVTNAGQTEATGFGSGYNGAYTYFLTVSSVSPTSGPTSAGTVVTINGTGFTKASTVTFGAVPATNVTFVSSVQLTATAPAGSIGSVNVLVTNAGQTESTGFGTGYGGQYTYILTLAASAPRATDYGRHGGDHQRHWFYRGIDGFFRNHGGHQRHVCQQHPAHGHVSGRHAGGVNITVTNAGQTESTGFGTGYGGQFTYNAPLGGAAGAAVASDAGVAALAPTPPSSPMDQQLLMLINAYARVKV